MPLTWMEVTFLGPRLAILVTRGRPRPAHGTAPHLWPVHLAPPPEEGIGRRGSRQDPGIVGEGLGGAEVGPSEPRAGRAGAVGSGLEAPAGLLGPGARDAGCKEGGGWASDPCRLGWGFEGLWVEVLNGSSVPGGKKACPGISRAGCGGPCQGDPGCSLKAAGLGLLGSLGRTPVRGVKGGTGVCVCVGRSPREAPCVPSLWSPELLGPGRS